MADKSYKHFYDDGYTTYHDDRSISKTSNGSAKDHEAVTGAYHSKWAPFTEKLRKLMKQNPSLPVVVSSKPSSVNDRTDCDIAYVHDHSTGAFKEKIIIIYGVNNKYPNEICNDDFDIPF